MKAMEMEAEVLMELCRATSEEDRRIARKRILQLMGEKERKKDPEFIVREVLLDIGAPDHLLGHPYVVDALLLMLKDGMYIHNITFGLYPQIAADYDTTAARVERAIRHLVEVTWTRGEWSVLQRYFGNTICAKRGKPTNGEFLARLVNVVKQRLHTAA